MPVCCIAIYVLQCHVYIMYRQVTYLSTDLLWLYLSLATVAIADLADKNSSLLVPDEGAEYDQLVEINLDEVCMLVSAR